MVKYIVAAALFSTCTNAIKVDRVRYNQYEEDDVEVNPSEQYAQMEADEMLDDTRTFGGDDIELLQIERQTTPIATPQNPLYSNVLFNDFEPTKNNRAKVPYDRAQAWKYHDGPYNNFGPNIAGLAQKETTPIATPQNPLYSNVLFNDFEPTKNNRAKVPYDRAQAWKYHDGPYDNFGPNIAGLAQKETTPIATPQNPLYSNVLFNDFEPTKNNRAKVPYDRAQAWKYHDGPYDNFGPNIAGLAQKETTPIATPQNPLYSNVLFNDFEPTKNNRAKTHYDRSQAWGYHDGPYDNFGPNIAGLAQQETTPIATPQNPLYSNVLFNDFEPTKNNRAKVAYDRAQAWKYHDGPYNNFGPNIAGL